MSNANDLENLRTAILSLQSGLMAVLDSLEILSQKSDKSEEFSQQIQIIKQAIKQLPNITSLQEASSELAPENPTLDAPESDAPNSDAASEGTINPSAPGS